MPTFLSALSLSAVVVVVVVVVVMVLFGIQVLPKWQQSPKNHDNEASYHACLNSDGAQRRMPQQPARDMH